MPTSMLATLYYLTVLSSLPVFATRVRTKLHQQKKSDVRYYIRLTRTNIKMAVPTGFEPATSGVTGQHSHR